MKLADNTYPDDDQQAHGPGTKDETVSLSRDLSALLTTFTLVGCDNSDDKPQAAAPAAPPASKSTRQNPMRETG
jgi:hypothetical protein